MDEDSLKTNHGFGISASLECLLVMCKALNPIPNTVPDKTKTVRTMIKCLWVEWLLMGRGEYEGN